jgi:flagellar hook-associated protein 1 FlgK
MSVFSVGQSALAAAQAGISTTGHNISNVNTTGYSRQEIVQSASAPQQFGSGYIGQGVEVTTVKRIYNEVLQKQALNAQSSSNASGIYAAKMSKIDSMLSDTDSGLTPALKEFFLSLSKLSANPGDAPTRQTVLSASNSLANRFNNLGSQLSDIQAEVNTQVTNSVSAINTYTAQIAKINDTIEKATNISGQPPNDLLDQRDQLVTELSKYVQTTTTTQGNSYNVFIGNGQPVVVGNSAYKLSAINSQRENGRVEVAYTGAGTTNAIQLSTSTLTGGTLGGLLDFRENSLDKIQSQLGQIAIVLSDTINTQQKLGQDLNGNTGAALTNFFSTSTPMSIPNTLNPSGTTVTLNTSIADTSRLTSSNYELKFDGTNYTLTRLNDNTQFTATSLALLNNAPAPGSNVDGLTFANTGTMQAGDSFLIKPTVNGATSIGFLMTQTSQIAAASATALANGLKGDGTNALNLNKLETQSLLYNGSTNISYSSAFSQLVSETGIKSNEMNVTNKAETNTLDNITKEQESTSGVNLDEEAANLMRYQQAYQAAGKLMQIANQMFSTLLSISG